MRVLIILLFLLIVGSAFASGPPKQHRYKAKKEKAKQYHRRPAGQSKKHWLHL
jgi:hypothetical protein